MSTPDPNTWYEWTLEAFLDGEFGNNGSMVVGGQSPHGVAIFVGPSGGEFQNYWQFFPDPTATNGTYYIIRPRVLGPDYFVITFLDGDDYVPTLNATFSPTARWAWQSWDDTAGTSKLSNQFEGEGALFDVSNEEAINDQGPNLVFMNSVDTTGSELGQHWVLKPISAINDPAFSSAPLAFPSVTQTTTTSSATTTLSSTSSPITQITAAATTTTTSPITSSASTTPTSSPTAISTSSSTSSLSGGAIAGIAIGAALGASLLAIFGLLFLQKRNRRRKHKVLPPAYADNTQVRETGSGLKSSRNPSQVNFLRPDLHHASNPGLGEMSGDERSSRLLAELDANPRVSELPNHHVP